MTVIVMVIAGGIRIGGAGAFDFVTVIVGAGVVSLLGLLFTIWKIDTVLDEAEQAGANTEGDTKPELVEQV